jgi:metal-responsive CopG/Arc/MetJ family transcriptional regulator
VADTQTLIQTRITKKQAKRLDKAQKDAGFQTRAEFLRQIVSGFLENEEKKERN